MKTRNVFKAFGIANIILLVLALMGLRLIDHATALSPVKSPPETPQDMIMLICGIVTLAAIAFAGTNGLLSLYFNYDWKDEIQKNKAIAIAEKVFNDLCNPAIRFFFIAVEGDYLIDGRSKDCEDRSFEGQSQIGRYKLEYRYAEEISVDKNDLRGNNVSVVITKGSKEKTRNVYSNCAVVEFPKS